MTKPIATLALIATLSATPALAQQTDQSFEEGFSLLGEGMALIMRALESEMAPMLEALGGMIEDANAYELPEVQDNGDIIIRRKVPLVPKDSVDPETGATDL
jgi:hypothetical protein